MVKSLKSNCLKYFLAFKKIKIVEVAVEYSLKFAEIEVIEVKINIKCSSKLKKIQIEVKASEINFINLNICSALFLPVFITVLFLHFNFFDDLIINKKFFC